MPDAVAVPSTSPPDGSKVDVDQLVARVAELERTQREEDVDGFLALFAPTAVWVTGGGRRLVGLETIGQFTRAALPGAMSDGSVAYEVEHVAFITPDVALTGVRQQYVDRAGRQTSAGSPSYVWLRGEGTWRIVAGQNTLVSPD